MIRRLLPILALLLILLVVAGGCGKKTDDDDTKVPLEVKKAESMDSTRLDSALTDTIVVDSPATEVSGE